MPSKRPRRLAYHGAMTLNDSHQPEQHPEALTSDQHVMLAIHRHFLTSTVLTRTAWHEILDAEVRRLEALGRRRDTPTSF